MKSIFTKLLVVGLFPVIAYSQTIVSTTVENRKAILEEFTGIHCVYCPQGHAIAEQILNNHPGDAFAINIHQGGYAEPGANEPDFRTPFGNAIANQTGLTGYPAGTVNRHYFPGRQMGAAGTTAMGRSSWSVSANDIIAMSSYLNMAVEASIDIDTRELVVHVESYYTGTSPQSTNLLNVALLQNNTLGPQTGGNAGNNYVHMRRLVHLVTGQWGEEITTTTSGTFVDRTYTYTIPAAYNDVPAVLSDMEIVVFMTETHQEIISGNGAFPSLIGLEYQNDPEMTAIAEISRNCSGTLAPVVTITNKGEQPVTSATIRYSVNSGEEFTYNWTGNLTSLHTAEIELPEIDFALEAVNNLEVTVEGTDQNTSNNTLNAEFDRANDTASNNLILEINTDHQGAQTRWIIRNGAGQMQTQGNGYGNNQTYSIDIELADADCYTFTLLDTGGNGGASLLLKDTSGQILIDSDGNYGGGFTDFFSIGLLGVADVEVQSISLYPNPTSGEINIESKDIVKEVRVFDMTGKLLKTFIDSKASITKVNLSYLNSGNYVLQLVSDKGISTRKIIIK